MSQRWISDIERGETTTPRLDALRRLADVLDLDVADLLYAGGLASTRDGARRIAGSADHADDLPSRDVTADLPDDRDNSPLTAAELDELKDAMFYGFNELEPADLREVIAVMRRRRKR